jgi:2-methylcitrate dehydratase PrpD
MPTFIESLCDAILTTDGGDSGQRALLGRAITDTIVAAAAGYSEPVVRRALSAYGGDGPPLWSGEGAESEEAAVMLDAIAGHALDYDDVYLESATHPSTVIVPTILRMGGPLDPDAIFPAFAAGLIAARAVNARLGPGHYPRGWHGTGTVGAFGAAAAAGRLLGLDAAGLRAAFGLVAAMSGGLQANFGTMAKPCQAGFAAAAGLRAARLAAAGITAAPDVFAPGGYPALYGDPDAMVAADAFELRPDRIALKLFPCCYGAHRLIGAGLDARTAAGPVFARETVTARLTVPEGSLKVLRFDRPGTALEAKFSAPFATVFALIDGPPMLAAFTDEAVARPDLRAAMERLSIVEDVTQPSGGEIDTGSVRLELFEGGRTIADLTRAALPGSPDDPVTPAQFRAKADACLAAYQAAAGRPLPMLEKLRALPEAMAWLSGEG